MILQQKRMPYLPLLLKKEIYQRKLKDVKQYASDYLTRQSSLLDILKILYKEEINKHTQIPVVKSQENKELLGTI